MPLPLQDGDVAGDGVPDPAGTDGGTQEKQRRRQEQQPQPGTAPGPAGDPAAPAPPPAPETGGDGCGPGTVMRDGICVVVMPGANDTAGIGDGGGGCLVDTVAYGTDLAPQVQRLRELRDSTVLSTVPGASFMGVFNTAYYTVSPAIADLERQNDAFRTLTRVAITPGIWVLGAVMPLAEPGSEVSVTAAGLLSVVLLTGMYAGPPSAGAWAVTRRLRSRRPAVA